MRESIAIIVASGVETTRQPDSSSSTLSRPWANFLRQKRIVGLVKYMSPYTGRILDWMAFALSSFAHSKRITEGCSLWDDFNANVAISNVYKWRHSDVIAIKLIALLRIKFPTKCIIRNFRSLKINRMMPFCNLFMERPSFFLSFIFFLSYLRWQRWGMPHRLAQCATLGKGLV